MRNAPTRAFINASPSKKSELVVGDVSTLSRVYLTPVTFSILYDFGRYCVNLIVKKETVFVLNSFMEMHGTGLKNFRLLGQYVEQILEHHSILTPLLRHQTSVSEVVL
jgi:hypothetical protein